MTITDLLKSTPLAQHTTTLQIMPRVVLLNPRMIFTAFLYATSAVPLSKPPVTNQDLLFCHTEALSAWDQGSAATIPSLPGFQQYFGIDSGADASAIQNFVSLVVLGQATGAAISFFINDRIGRLWSIRLYFVVYMIAQIITLAAPNRGALYTGRIIAGIGAGALTVTGPISLAEIAPVEVRGLICAWFAVTMGLAHFCAVFCAYGVKLHVESGRLQYQIVMLAPCVYLSLWIAASFFLCESPRWLFLAGKPEKATKTLCDIRRLPIDHPRMQSELADCRSSSSDESHDSAHGLPFILRQMFTSRSNLRRLQQCLICYALPQLSGASSISSYFVPILELIGVSGGSDRKLFLTGMYTLSRFFYALITSFFLIDLLGRRRSLFLGCILQAAGDLYIAVYLNVRQSHDVSESASQAAVALIFIHSFGYSAGESREALTSSD